MYKYLRPIFVMAFLLSMHISFAQVAINDDNSNPDPTAMLDVKSTDKGVLVPRLTTAQRELIPGPANGLLVWDSDTESFWFFNQNKWIELIDRANSPWSTNTNDDIYSLSANLGLGTLNPTRQLHSYFNNSNINTSSILIEQDGSGDAFFNIGLTGSHHYSLGVDNSHGGMFKIGYDATSPLGVFQGTRLSISSTGKVGIGTTSTPTDRFQVDADSAENALRIRQNGATKLRVHANGGTSIGVNTTPPVDGLLVMGAIEPRGNIISNQNLLIESTGAAAELRLKKDQSEVLFDDTQIAASASENIIFETSTQNNKVQMNNEGISLSTDENIVIETTSDSKTITIKVGFNEIIISENGAIEINSSGNDLAIITDGGDLSLTTNNGDLNLDAGNGHVNISGNTMDFLASGSMLIQSNGPDLDIDGNSNLTLTSGSSLKVDAGNDLDLDGSALMTLNAPLIHLNNGGAPAARLGTQVLVNTVTGFGTIQPTGTSSTVIIGN